MSTIDVKLKMSNEIKLNGKTIGDNSPIYFIADIGANHDGNLERAFNLIELAKNAGADDIRIQFEDSEQVATIEGRKVFVEGSILAIATGRPRISE